MSNRIFVQLPVTSGDRLLQFTYTNWRGETAVRTVLPINIQYGMTPEHPEPTWLLCAFCQDRQAHRSFMMSKMLDVQPL